MRFNRIRRVTKTNARRIYDALKLLNRHALVLVPLLLLTFSIIAGWVATDYGTHYLFRDNDPLELWRYFTLCDRNIPCIFSSARFHTALYATALMGMVWTLFVLIENREQDAAKRHPIVRYEPVLPGAVLLGLLMVAAIPLNSSDPERQYAILILSGLGFAAGLLVVWFVTWLGLLLSLRIRCHQVWPFLVLSASVALGVSLIPLVTPSKAIFIALAFAVALYCLFEIAQAQYRLLVAATILVFMIIGTSIPTFKYRFDGLDRYYEAWPPKQSSQPAGAGASLLDPNAALQAWLQQPGISNHKKLVIVAASGGAYRATFWTASVLDSLGDNPKLPGFDRSIRLMTGASGGMVALAYYAASRQPPAGARPQADASCASRTTSPGTAPTDGHTKIESLLLHDLEVQRKKIWLANSPTDSLTPIVQRMIGNDVPYVFLPSLNRHDRGKALEEQWLTLQLPFCELERGEREGWRPSLIISPYLVDTGRPMFISNLNLKNIIDPGFVEEFFRHFPDAHQEFKLATGVRMSATFPLISPAVRLPLPDRSRVVDAGYFDNFGIVAAATFLRDRAVRDFVQKNDLDVILLRILAFDEPSTEQADAPDNNSTGRFRWWDWLDRLFEPWSSPLEGALAARETNGRFANELLLKDLRGSYQGRFHDFKFIYQPTDASFSWHIQREELKKVKAGMSAPENQKESRRLEQSWQGKTP
jgi:hypothetical protein